MLDSVLFTVMALVVSILYPFVAQRLEFSELSVALRQGPSPFYVLYECSSL